MSRRRPSSTRCILEGGSWRVSPGYGAQHALKERIVVPQKEARASGTSAVKNSGPARGAACGQPRHHLAGPVNQSDIWRGGDGPSAQTAKLDQTGVARLPTHQATTAIVLTGLARGQFSASASSTRKTPGRLRARGNISYFSTVLFDRTPENQGSGRSRLDTAIPPW